MTIHPSLFSKRTDERPTPQSFFDLLNAEFRFTLDPCATAGNAKCPTFFTRADDGVRQDWGRHWARKCYEASHAGALVVLLAHSRTDTRWFHDWVYGKASEIRFLKGSLRFGDGSQPAPFPSLVAVYRPVIGGRS